MSAGTAVFTIIAKNYLPYARVLMSSVALHHPNWRRFVILVDAVDGYFDPRWENFEIIFSSALPCPKIEWFQFKYTTLELSTAIKPYSFDYLLKEHRFEQVIYLDPDIKLYSRLDKVTEALTSCNIALTPHLTQALEDDKFPSEISILRSGSYNLGFIAVAQSSTTTIFLKWWEEKLYDQCVVDLAEGLFVDQRWIDLVPGLFEGVNIIRDPGYNVAYWNLSHRNLTTDRGQLKVNGSPLAFFHFSGYDPANENNLSRHQNRFTVQDLSIAAQSLLRTYGRDLISAGFLGCQNWPYTFATFRNGINIPDLCRPIHHEEPELVNSVGDPFSDQGFQSFVRVWNTPHFEEFPGVSKLAYRIYQMRADVRRQMPDIFGRDYRAFLEWMLKSARAEHNIPKVFLAPMTAASYNIEQKASSKVEETKVATVQEQNQFVDVEDRNSTVRWTKLALAIFYSRPDLQASFPDPFGENCLPFLLWFLTRGKTEHRLSPEQLSPLNEQFDSLVVSMPNALSRIRQRLTLRKKRVSAVLMSIFTERSLSILVNRIAPRVPALELVASNPDLRKKSLDKTGVNLVGYLYTETGVGQSARGAFSALKSVSIPVKLISAGDSNPSRKEDYSVGPVSGESQHAANLFYVNADQTNVVKRLLGPEFYQNRINIGYWAWELEDFPNCWHSSFSLYQEIWTPSSFCCEAIKRKSPIPVTRVAHAVSPPIPQGMGRDYFGIPQDRFIFLTALDVLSVVERKNPRAVIKAFQSAFNGDPNYELIVKINNAPAARQEVQTLREACSATPGVRLFDATLKREEMYSLSRCADCFVSLHRSEGFGLLIAEAMYFGKPVIVTNYSGNLDFTLPDNSFLVDYKLRPVGQNCAPYPSNNLWADASVEHAAHKMLEVVRHSELTARKAMSGSDFIRRSFNPEVIGQKMRDRLSLLQPSFRAQKIVDSSPESEPLARPKTFHALGVGS